MRTETVRSVVSMGGGVSGGTIDSMRQQAILMRADAAVRAIVADPYGLSPDRPAEPRSRGAEAGAEADAGADAGAGAGALAKTCLLYTSRCV